MVQQVQVYLFGDQTYDVNSRLRDLLLLKGNPILTTFFEQAYFVIRAEIGRLPVKERGAFPKFTCLGDILARQREGGLNPAFQTPLTTIYQLGSFIRQHGESGRAYPAPADTYLLGLCTGALAAAAISSSKTLSELLPAAVQTVLVSFRLGLCVVDLRNRLELSPDNSASWSMVVPGLTAEAAATGLKEHSQARCLPPITQPFISAYAPKATTISGPPSVLKELRKAPFLAGMKIKSIPIYVPAHSSHIFTRDDVKSILETTSPKDWAACASSIPVVSCSTGKLIWAGNFISLLEMALLECLTAPLRWDNICEEFPVILRAGGASNIKLTPVATNGEQILYSALKDFARDGAEHAKYWPQSSFWPSADELPTPSIELDYQDGAQLSDIEDVPSGKSKIAIVGMSGRFPEAESPEAFWDLLRKGLDVAKPVPISRWNAETHVDPTGQKRNTGATPWGCWLNNPGLFDARFFSLSPKEAPQVDPAQRLSLMTTYEALERAGIVPDSTPSTQRERFGVFHGVTSNDYMETNSAQDIDTHFIPGGNRAFIPGRINYCFKFGGPSISVDTACSSSLAALHIACNALWRNDCDTAIAGGTNMITNPDGHAGLDRGFFLSRTGNCKAFDDGADGYCRGESIVSLVLKRLEDAIADDDPIQAIILDANTNHSSESDSMTRPHIGAQKAIFDKVLNHAGVDPFKISYVEMHGTGTQAGDAVEMTSVLDTFAPEITGCLGRRGKDQALYLGAAKANIGHGEGVSGVTSIAKVLLMMKNNTIPPHCGIKTKINHNYPTDFDARNVHIAFEPVPWKRYEGETRKVLVNNFSAAGGNSAVLIEDAPIIRIDGGIAADPRTSHIIAVSAKCASSLTGNLKAMITYLSGDLSDGVSLSRLSYTTTARRQHHPHRAIVSGSNFKEVKARLEEALARGDGINRKKIPPKVVFAFTGQGSQYLAMGWQLFEAYPTFKADIRHLDQLAQSQGFQSFQQIFVTTDGDIGDLTPLVVQLAYTCMQIAMARLWISWGVTPSAVVGHSLGEYAALNISGVLSDSETIYLVGKRAELLQRYCKRGTHSMLAVKASTTEVQRLLAGKKYEISCINSPDDTVLAGPNEQIKALQTALAEHQLKMTILKTPYAFHSSQVDHILASFEGSSRGVTFQKPSIPVICPLFGNVITEEGTFGPNYLARHCRESVNMRDALLNAKKTQVISDKTVFIEIGPHSVVTGMLKATLGQHISAFPTLQRGKEPWPLITAAITTLYSGGFDICWAEYHREFKSSHLVLELPAYSWDLKEYWIPYENDWALDKVGLNSKSANTESTATQREAKPAPKPESKVVNPALKLESTTVHKVVSEIMEGESGTIIVESDISRPDLFPIAQGHKVNGIPLCTPSVYADVALTVGTYLLDRFYPEMKDHLVDVSSLVVESALIPHGKGPQLLHSSFEVDLAAKSAKCTFYSVDDKRQKTTEHGWCTILFKDRSLLDKLQQMAPDYLARIDRLREGMANGRSLRMNSAQGYKFISPLAQFAPDYRAVDEVILDSETLESSSIFNFSRVKKGGSFNTHPAYIDCLTQPGGFVMNCKDSTDMSVQIFVNHGWESFQIYEEISPEKTYQSYVRMGKAKSEGTIWEGDTIIFDGTRVVAFLQGVALRGMPRKFFQMILEAGDSSKPKAKKHLPTPSKPSALSHNAEKATEKPAPVKVTHPSPAASQLKVAPPITQDRPKPTTSVVQVTQVVQATSAPALKAPTKPKEDKVTPALQIVSEESGISLEDLTEDCAFADIGVDSLLSMVIASRFREELGLDLDLEFSIFMDLPTVKHMKDFLDPPSKSEEQAVKELEPAAPPVLEFAKVIPPEPAPAAASMPVVPAPRIISQPKEKEDKTTPALQIVSEESGIAIEDLTDDCAFADIGVDSLLSMVIASRFREELGLDLDLEFSFFMDLPTVKHMKDFLDPAEDPNIAEVEEIAPMDGKYAPFPQVGDISAPLAEETVRVPDTIADTTEVSAASAELIENALQIISEESGIAVEDLTDDCLFTEIGVDSLLSMVIASRFREELGLDLDLEFSVFLELPTVKHMKLYLGSGGKNKEVNAKDSSSPDEWDTSDISTPNKVTSDAGVESLSSECSSSPEGNKPKERGTCRPATSVILQGFPKSAKITLFLLPDGGGSSSSYVPLPRINADCALVGLNCPYARDAWNLKCHHDDLIDAYLNEIRRRQPSGPYHLGGWSSGGIMAYMVAYKLIRAGERVANLIAFDSPVPKIMDRLPTKFHEFCDSIGLFGNAMGAAAPTAPEWLIPHFNATVDVLADYHAVPIPKGTRMPKMSIIWACEAVLDESVIPPEELVNSKGIHFLTEKRSNFGTCGWEELLPGAEFLIDRVEGGSHFTMMQKPLVAQVANFIERAISS